MAYGLLGKAVSVQADTPVTVYTVPTSGVDFTTASISFCNTASSDALVSLYYSTSATASLEDTIESHAVIPPTGILTRTCSLLSPGERVIFVASIPDVVCRVEGLEKKTV